MTRQERGAETARKHIVPSGPKSALVAVLREGDYRGTMRGWRPPWPALVAALRPLPDMKTRAALLLETIRREGIEESEYEEILADAQANPAEVEPGPRWPQLGEDGQYGLAWEIVARALPGTEADGVAVLLSLLVLYGNYVGRRAYVTGGGWHHSNEYLILCGNSATGRKGTAYTVARNLMRQVDDGSWGGRIVTGIGSGEALIDLVRDPRVKEKVLKDEQGGDIEDPTTRRARTTRDTEDVGVADKRLVWWCAEFSRILHLMDRAGNTMPDVLREAWDDGNLDNITRANAARATGAHVSLITAITKGEAKKLFGANDMTNGFANRFLWCMARRSKDLPDGGTDLALDHATLQALRAPLHWLLQENRLDGQGRQLPAEAPDRPVPFRRDAEGAALWAEIYRSANRDREGIYGAMTARAVQHMLRLQLIFALLDGSQGMIRIEHVRAARAVWRYCAASLFFIWNTTAADPVADYLYHEMCNAEHMMDFKEIMAIFDGKKSAEVLRGALESLREQRLVVCKRVGTGGRPAERWVALAGALPEHDF